MLPNFLLVLLLSITTATLNEMQWLQGDVPNLSHTAQIERTFDLL